MTAATYPAMTIYAGDTWPGIPGIEIRPNELPPEEGLANAHLIFYSGGGGPDAPGLTLGIETGLVFGPSAWEIIVPPQVLTLGLGKWVFRFSTTDSAGLVRTWLTGTLTIL